MNTIGVCGFCTSGSSAVVDYLKEFEQNQVIDEFEFTLTYLPDGFEDLEYNLLHHCCRDDASCLAIPRFRRFMVIYGRRFKSIYGISPDEFTKRLESYLGKLIQFTWKGTRRPDVLLYPSFMYDLFATHLMVYRVIPFLNKKLKRHVKIWPYRDIELSTNPASFNEESRLFIKDMLKWMKADFSKNIVLSQPFIGEDPVRSFHFFDNPKAIVVDRDPRDIYLFNKLFFMSDYIMPTDTVENFCKYHRILRDNRPYKEPHPDVLHISFDELVYEYDKTTALVRDFCGLPEPSQKNKYFRPELSRNNTQLWLRYLGYEDDMKYIEDNLSEYIFDFSKYPAPDTHAQMFDDMREVIVHETK